MARLKYGPYGPIVGKLGNHIGYIRRGEGILRMIGHPSNKPKSLKQLAAFDRMRVVMEFISPLNSFINVSFKPAILGTTKIQQNAAVSNNIKTSVVGEYPNLEMDYSKAVLSKGNLMPAVNPEVSYTLDRSKISITFKWDADSLRNYSDDYDQVMMAAYLPANKNAFFCLSGARRMQGEDVLVGVINRREGDSENRDRFIETYITFVSDDRMQVSDSVYVGRIDLGE